MKLKILEMLKDIYALLLEVRKLIETGVLERQLWDARTVAKYLGVSYHTVMSKYRNSPYFPPAHRPQLDEDEFMHPRWPAKSIIGWAENPKNLEHFGIELDQVGEVEL